MSYQGDIRLGDTIDVKFTTRQISGAPTTLAGSPVISAYVGNGTTEITAGITLTVDFDSRTGLNNVRVVATSGNGFATATNVQLVITTGTVNSVSVVGEVVGEFSIENRSALMPATAGRTAVVDAAGLIDANTVKVGPTGSGTAQTARDIGASVLLSAGSGTGQLDFTSGVVKANATQWLGGTIPAVNVTGVPKVDLVDWLGTAPLALTSQQVQAVVPTTQKVDVETIKTQAVTCGAGVTMNPSVGTTANTTTHLNQIFDTDYAFVYDTTNKAFNDSVKFWNGTAVATPNKAGVPVVDTRQVVRNNTAQSTGNSTTAIKLDSGASATNSFYKYHRITIVEGTGAPQSAICTAYNGGTKVATVAPAWPTAPDGTSVFLIETNAQSDVEVIKGTASPAQAGYFGLDWTYIANTSTSQNFYTSHFGSECFFNGSVVSATSTTATLDGSVGADATIVGCRLRIISGTGIYQERVITAWVDATATATLDRAWVTNPIVGDGYQVLASDAPKLDNSLRVYALDGSGAAIAPASTALSTAQWTNARAGYLDNLSGGAVALSATALSTAQWTNARAGYLDKLNVSGNVASQADVQAVNQSASKHITLISVPQYEPGETYTVEMRTFSALTGAAVNADSTPTLTATGNVSGDLSANLSVASNPATGVYRWTYTPGASPTLEQIRFDGSATISASTFTQSYYAQTVDEATAVFTSTDQSHLTSIFNKLPVNNIADETLVLAAVGSPMQAYTQPTGFLAANFTTGIPVSGDLSATMKTSVQTAADAAITANATIAEIEAETDGIAAIPTSTLSQADIRTAVGLASANLDTQIASLATATNLAEANDDLDELIASVAAISPTAIASAVRTTAMTEAYAADGAAPTMEQMFFMIWADLHEFSISGTTITAKKLDKSTTAMTHTLDNANSPTSKTRAT